MGMDIGYSRSVIVIGFEGLLTKAFHAQITPECGQIQAGHDLFCKKKYEITRSGAAVEQFYGYCHGPVLAMLRQLGYIRVE